MNANLHSLELQLRCRTGDAGAWPAHAIGLCCDGFRQHIDRTSRRSRLAPVMALASFVALTMFALLFGAEHQTVPMLECFAGMIVWIVIFYGLSGQMQWQRSRSADVLRSGRVNAWWAMLGLFMLSVRHIAEQRIKVMVAMLAVILRRLRACVRVRLGVADPNLTAFRLVPPVSAHA